MVLRTAQKPAAGRLRGESFWLSPRVSRNRDMPASLCWQSNILEASTSRQCKSLMPLHRQCTALYQNLTHPKS